jgi:protein tyrosine phosphatase (PTP) superfamily phosphohydrolase (DUF442 family)
MNRFLLAVAASVVISTSVIAAEQQPKDRTRLDQIEQSLKSDVPRVLCLDNNFATGGQPSEQAFAKVAASGFHSVLSLRAAGEGIDLTKERALVEKAGLRYFNIPVVSTAPRVEQADEFIRLVKEKSKPPDAHQLRQCQSGRRVYDDLSCGRTGLERGKGLGRSAQNRSARRRAQEVRPKLHCAEQV